MYSVITFWKTFKSFNIPRNKSKTKSVSVLNTRTFLRNNDEITKEYVLTFTIITEVLIFDLFSAMSLVFFQRLVASRRGFFWDEWICSRFVLLIKRSIWTSFARLSRRHSVHSLGITFIANGVFNRTIWIVLSVL